MSLKLSAPQISSIETLAQEFLDATVHKWGTDEVDATHILREVHATNHQMAFEAAVLKQLNGKDRHRFCLNATRFGVCSPVIPILADEMSMADFSRAGGTYLVGRDVHVAHPVAYFVKGILSTTDLSTTESKVNAALVVGGLVTLTYVNPPIGLAVSAALATGIMITSMGGMMKNAIEMIYDTTTKDYEGMCEDTEDMGFWIGIGVLNGLAAPRFIRRLEKDIAPLSPNIQANKARFKAAVQRAVTDPNHPKLIVSRQIGNNKTQVYFVDTPAHGRWIVDTVRERAWEITHVDQTSIQGTRNSSEWAEYLIGLFRYMESGRTKLPATPPTPITGHELPPAVRDRAFHQLGD